MGYNLTSVRVDIKEAPENRPFTLAGKCYLVPETDNERLASAIDMPAPFNIRMRKS